MAVESPLLETKINGASHVIINISGDITLADANDAASYVQEQAGADVNIIFGAMYDETMEDACTITVIATGLTEAAAAPQNRLGGGSAFQQPSSLKGLNVPRTPGAPQGTIPKPGAAPFNNMHKATDIRSSVEEKTLNIPEFLQRK